VQTIALGKYQTQTQTVAHVQGKFNIIIDFAHNYYLITDQVTPM
jgi:hypothetical protein